MHEQLEILTHGLHNLADVVADTPYPISDQQRAYIQAKILTSQRAIRAISDILDAAAAGPLEGPQTTG